MSENRRDSRSMFSKFAQWYPRLSDHPEECSRKMMLPIFSFSTKWIGSAVVITEYTKSVRELLRQGWMVMPRRELKNI